MSNLLRTLVTCYKHDSFIDPQYVGTDDDVEYLKMRERFQIRKLYMLYYQKLSSVTLFNTSHKITY